MENELTYNVKEYDNGYKIKQLKTLGIDFLKQQSINKSKSMLEQYLESHPYQFIDNKYYTVTKEKQSLLTSALAIHQIKTTANIPSVLKWNAVGEECVVWTDENLSLLAISIADYVSPLVSNQQSYEVQINACETVEAIDAIVIDYSL
jgi:hypothetical protein